MTPNQTPTGPAASQSLSAVERRILGVLVEKAKTTPDVYPLSLNSLTTGCNQKSNREPVMSLDDVQVEDCLASLQKKGLVSRVIGGRVERWRHMLYDQWHLDKPEMAIITELLLRGPQTEGELRGRASRMEAIEDLDGLRSILKRLTERGMVVYLSPLERRGTMVTHGFHAPEELARLKKLHADGASFADEPAATRARPVVDSVAPSHDDGRLATLQAEVVDLRSKLSLVTKDLEALAIQVRTIKEGLGI